MGIYARILDGRVVELLEGETHPSERFHPAILWVALSESNSDGVGLNWTHESGVFAPPPPADKEA